METRIIKKQNIEYAAKGETIIKMSYIGALESDHIDILKIPSTIKGIKISRIKSKVLDSSVRHYLHIKKLVIPSGITEIEPSAFEEINADEVIWPSSCKKISENCFSLSLIKTISNIQGVEEIERFAFFRCKNLKEFEWPANCSTIPKYCFIGCENLKDFSFKDVICIKESAFADSGLTHALNTEEITVIEEHVFESCLNLKQFTWPNNCDSIPINCFIFSGLQKISNIENVKTIEEGAFRYCKKLKSITWPDTCSTIPIRCFADSGIEKISNLKAVKEIQEGAFNGCPLKSLDLRESILFNTGVNIDNKAFDDIKSITFIT